MLSSRRSKFSNADSAPGESLFDFLRRKKKVALEDSMINSRKQCNEISISHIQAKQEEDQPELAKKTSHRKSMSSAITPKKVTFAESEEKNRQTARTFIDMISPAKKSSRIEQKDIEEEQDQNSSKSILQSSKRKQSINEQEFNRREFNKSLQAMLETIKKLIQTGKSLKQKSHSLFIDMKPVFKVAEENDNKIIKRKVEDAKEKLRVMEHLFGELDIRDDAEILEKFHQTVSEHLISMEAKIKTKFDKMELQSSSKIRNQKNLKITDLATENKALNNNISILQKKIEKLEHTLEINKAKDEQKFETYQHNNQGRYERLESKLQQVQQERDLLKDRIVFLEKENAQKQKKAKNALYEKEQAERRVGEQASQAISSRQQFLLNQLSTLKQEFQHDITQLTNLYRLKQDDQNKQIEHLQLQIRELTSRNTQNKQNQKQMKGDAESMKALVNKYRKQNDCLVTDLHRINEELYQHWLALKDIKVLATRLHLMPKFATIYQDLGFNELMFS